MTRLIRVRITPHRIKVHAICDDVTVGGGVLIPAVAIPVVAMPAITMPAVAMLAVAMPAAGLPPVLYEEVCRCWGMWTQQCTRIP